MFWEKEKKKTLQEVSAGYFVPPPKRREYKTIVALLDSADFWRDAGDTQLEKKTWEMIAEKAIFYSKNTPELGPHKL